MRSVFRVAWARSGKRKNGPEPAPASRAPNPVALRNSRREMFVCLLRITLPIVQKETLANELARVAGEDQEILVLGLCPSRAKVSGILQTVKVLLNFR